MKSRVCFDLCFSNIVRDTLQEVNDFHDDDDAESLNYRFGVAILKTLPNCLLFCYNLRTCNLDYISGLFFPPHHLVDKLH